MNNTSSTQKWLLAATSISYIIVIMDTSIVNVALAPLAATLHSSITGLQWVVSAYTVTFASLLLSGGALGDKLGAKKFISPVLCYLHWLRPDVAFHKHYPRWLSQEYCRVLAQPYWSPPLWL